MTEPTITIEQAAKDENGVYRYKDGTPRDGCNAPPPDNGELGIYTGKEAIVFDWFCDRGMQPPTTEEIEDLLNRLAAKSEFKQDAKPSEGREQACIDCGDARCVYQETKDCPKASNPAVDLQKLAEETAKKFFTAIYDGCHKKKSSEETAKEMESVILSALRAARGMG